MSDDVPPIVQQQREVFAWMREQIRRASPDTSPMNWVEEVRWMSKDYCAQLEKEAQGGR